MLASESLEGPVRQQSVIFSVLWMNINFEDFKAFKKSSKTFQQLLKLINYSIIGVDSIVRIFDDQVLNLQMR